MADRTAPICQQLATTVTKSHGQLTSVPMVVAALSYAGMPVPCHRVTPFKVLVVTQAMLIGFLKLLAFRMVSKSQVKLTRDPTATNHLQVVRRMGKS